MQLVCQAALASHQKQMKCCEQYYVMDWVLHLPDHGRIKIHPMLLLIALNWKMINKIHAILVE